MEFGMTVQQEARGDHAARRQPPRTRRRSPDRRLRGRRQRRDPVHLGLAANRRRLLRLSRSPTKRQGFGHRAAVLRAVDANGEDVARASIPAPQLLAAQSCPQRLPDGTSVFASAQGARRRAARVVELDDRDGTHVAVWMLPIDRRWHLFRLQPGERLPATAGYEQTAPMEVGARERQRIRCSSSAGSRPRSPRSSCSYEDESSGGVRPGRRVRPRRSPCPRTTRAATASRSSLASDQDGQRAPATRRSTQTSTGTYPCEKPVDIWQGRHVLPVVERAPVGGARSMSREAIRGTERDQSRRDPFCHGSRGNRDRSAPGRAETAKA